MSTGSSPSEFDKRGASSRCVFCDTVGGRAPASKVLETARLLVLVPLRPKCEGHCLVIPKQHAVRMQDLPDETLHEIATILKRLAGASNLRSYNILQNNGPHSNDPGVRRQPSIEHVHFHLIPRTKGDGIRIMAGSTLAPSRHELDRMAARIRRKLEPRRRSAP